MSEKPTESDETDKSRTKGTPHYRIEIRPTGLPGTDAYSWRVINIATGAYAGGSVEATEDEARQSAECLREIRERDVGIGQ